MDVFALRSEIDKQAFYEIAAEKKNLSEEIIEKDFWVCWTLKKLFSLPNIGENLLFKGGTSLSKAYHLIERFSEDIDISIDKNYFGFSGRQDPEQALSNKRRQLLIKDLSDACRNFVGNELKAMLEKVFRSELKSYWELTLDPDDPDGQALLFHYPTVSTQQKNAYIRKAVKIELGCRGGRDPITLATISPFVEEIIPNTMSEPNIHIKTLAAERTFWEKATILHMYAHWPENKKIPERQSRHFFDFYKLLRSPVKQAASNIPDLLFKVAQHKKIYFRAGWANYDDAAKGTLKLIPKSEILELLRQDYGRMQDMFYGEPINWTNLISEIDAFEHAFNQLQHS